MLKKVILFFVLLLFSDKLFSCSSFIVKAKDGSVLSSRSMEFPVDLRSRIWLIPRGAENKYGYLGLDGVGKADLISEGMNEKGLSVSALMFSSAKYQTVVQGKKVVPITHFVSYLLGSCATVTEVKQELEKIRVVNENVKELGGFMGFHFAIYDANKGSIVVEFIDGETRIHDNPLGVATNMPEFSWHMTNLSNYMNLDPHDKSVTYINGVKVAPIGVGTGLLGLPGDWTPPSRFVRLAWSVSSALPAKDYKEAMILSSHLLNSIDIPKGVIKEHDGLYGYAQWIVIKDLTNKVLYYRTYENQTLKSIDMKKLNFNVGSRPKSLSVEGVPYVADLTDQL